MKLNNISASIGISQFKVFNKILKKKRYIHEYYKKKINIIENFENHIDPKDPTNNCLDVAIITAPEKRTKKTIEKLNTVAGRVLKK